jgi:cytochrome P450
MKRDAPTFLLQTARLLGPTFQVGVGPLTLTIVGAPEDLQHVLQKRATAWGRGTAVNGVRPFLGNGLPLSDPPLWLMQRRTMQPSFHKSHFSQWVELIREATQPTLLSLKAEQIVMTRSLMMRITRDVIVRAIFSTSLGSSLPRVDEALQDIEQFIAEIAIPIHLPLWVPTRVHRRFRAAVRSIDETLDRLIEARRREPQGSGDLLSVLVRATDPETGVGMSNRQLRDEVVNLFFAGHETTANMLTWTVSLLSRHPSVRRRLVDEVQQTVGLRPIETDDVARLPLTNAVLREALRLYPPAWMFARQALEGDTIREVAMPQGAVVLVLPYIAHRLEAHWEAPEEFRPERFLENTSLDAAVWKYRYLPFGAGPHVCIGNHFAMLEGTVVLASLLQRGVLDALQPEAPAAKVGATLAVADELPAVFRPHGPASSVAA